MDTILQLYRPEGHPAKYKAVAEAIRQAIAEQLLVAGSQLPPVRDLAWDLKITPGTVARAYTTLTDEGILTAVVGRGTFVALPEAQQPGVLDHRCEWPAQQDDSAMVKLFSPTLPDVGQVALIQDGLTRLSSRRSLDLLSYPTRDTFEPARQAVMRWLAGTPLGPLDPDDIVLSHGGQNGVTLVMQAVLRGRRPVVVVEELCYPGFRRAAELMRAEVVTVPMDGQGIIPEALEAVVSRHNAQLLCTSPEIQNPTGIITPLSRRKQIAEIAQRFGMQILEDDCYRIAQSHHLCYRALLPRHSWYVASISKALTPALRVGFVVAPHEKRADLRRVAEHGFFGLALPLAHLTADLLMREETYEIVARVNDTLAQLVRRSVNILGGFDIAWREDVPFLWLNLPQGWRAGAFCQAAEAQGVQVRSAEDFTLRDARAPHAVRIAVNAQASVERFEAAIHCLRRLLDNPPEQIAV